MKTSLSLNLPRAGHELSDEQIAARFGPLLREGLRAFREDISYLEAVALDATAHRQRVEARARAAHKTERAVARIADRLTALRPAAYRPVAERDARVYILRKQGLSKRDVMVRLGVTVEGYKASTRRLKDAGMPVADQRVGGGLKSVCRALRAQGLTYDEIGERVGLSEATVRFHCGRIRR